MYIDKNSANSTHKEIAAAIQIWNRGIISLIDIRHNLISNEEALCGYRLPANVFLYTSGGEAEILLNDTAYNVTRYGLFHGIKGTELTIIPHCDWLEYYMVLYKAAEPPLHKSEYRRLMEQVNPYRQQYGYMPYNPLFFLEELRIMYEKWKDPTPLNIFYGKAAFSRFVYEVYKELEQGQIQIFKPDLVLMATRFLEKNYREIVSINELCEGLGISYSHFYRRFKQKTGKSPQEYLIHMRLTAATEFLKNSQASIREIADYCGFQDERNLQRMFSKNFGMTPNAYRENTSHHMRDDDLGKQISFSYNCESQVSFDKPGGKGANYMFKQMKSKMAVAAAVSMILLLNACGSAPVNNESGNSAQSKAVTSQAEQQVDEETRVVSTVRGDVTIPQSPQKVVVMNYAFGDVLALGVTPAAINDYWAITGSAVEDLLKDIPRASELEEIMRIEPDLIITAYEKDEDYEKLSKIAPTVSFGTAKDTTQLTTEERLSFLSNVLGVDDSVKDKVLSDYTSHMEQARQKLADAGYKDESVTLMNNSLEQPDIVVSTYKGAQALYDELGMTRSEKGHELYKTGEWYANISLEVLPEYCGDYIILYGDGKNNAFSGNGVYESLEAVKNGNVILMNEYLSTFNDVISIRSQIDFIVEELLALKTQG